MAAGLPGSATVVAAAVSETGVPLWASAWARSAPSTAAPRRAAEMIPCATHRVVVAALVGALGRSSRRVWRRRCRRHVVALSAGAYISMRRGRSVSPSAMTRAAWSDLAAEPGRDLDSGAGASATEDAVVKIFVTRQRASMSVPWQTLQVEASSGSGTLIWRRDSANSSSADLEVPTDLADGQDVDEVDPPPYWHCGDLSEALGSPRGDLVLTAAHVIADARDVRVQLLSRNDAAATPEKFAAQVVAVCHDSDLALLEVADPACFEGAQPMRLFGPRELLDVQSRVWVMGFPVGGDYLSITEGVLSRVEVVDYCHSRRATMAFTVDAAINAGNSGGPVVDPASGRMLAVAHQKVMAMGVENQGHAVPPCLIWRFLYGQARGWASPMPSLGVFLQTLESSAHRERLQLNLGESGVLIREVTLGPSESSDLKAGDVMLKVGGFPIDNFGAVRLLGHRVSFSVVQDLFYIGDIVNVLVRRQGEDVLLRIPLRPSLNLVPRCIYGTGIAMEPAFYICGGLVFSPVTTDLLEQTWPNPQDRPPHLMDLYYREVVSPQRREAVVCVTILSDDVNAGHGSGYVGYPVVERVNGEPVVDIVDLARRLERAVNESPFVEIDFQMAFGPYTVVLKSADVPEADHRIQELYQIPVLASPGLLQQG